MFNIRLVKKNPTPSVQILKIQLDEDIKGVHSNPQKFI